MTLSQVFLTSPLYRLSWPEMLTPLSLPKTIVLLLMICLISGYWTTRARKASTTPRLWTVSQPQSQTKSSSSYW